MSSPRTNPLIRLMPSFTDVAFLLPVAFLFAGQNGVRTMLGDGDTGWHVRTGEWIIANHRVPQTDMFSFTRPGQPWYAWEWLWDVCFAWLHRQGGLGAVVIGSLLVVCVASALLYRLVYRATERAYREMAKAGFAGAVEAENPGGNPLVAIALTALTAAGASLHWLARPHLFTLLFLVIFLSVLDRVRDAQSAGRTSRLLWALPLLTILWTNLHGGFFVGIVCIGAYAGGELVRAILARNREQRTGSVRRALPYVWTAAGCLAASLVNPYTYHLHVHIVKYLRDPFLLNYIAEFQAANLRAPWGQFFELMLALSAGAAIWHWKRGRYAEVLMLVGWGHLGLMVVRNIPIFMVVAAPIAAEPVVDWLRAAAQAPVAGWIRALFATLKEAGEETVEMERPWRVHAFSAVVLAVLSMAILSPAASGKLQPTYNPKSYPEKALAVLNRPGQRIFTHDEWGDYLVYQLWPKGTKVFVDGRSDFYGKFDQDYLDVINVKWGWQDTLARYGVDTILLPPDAPLTGALKESSRWRVVYDDTVAVVFRPANQVPADQAGRYESARQCKSDGVDSSSGQNQSLSRGQRAPAATPRKRPAAVEQVSTGSLGGVGGRDLPITAVHNVHPTDHENHLEKGVTP
jgi:hypothetical protein